MGIKKLLLLSISIYFLVLLTDAALADNIAYLHVQVANAPPRINNIFIMPEIAYFDSALSCEADIYDENISLLKVEYKWIVNGVIVGKEKYLENKFDVGEEVSCEITATDYLNQISNSSIAIKILPRGILQTTGYAVRNLGQKPQADYGASIILLVIFALGFGISKKHKQKVISCYNKI